MDAVKEAGIAARLDGESGGISTSQYVLCSSVIRRLLVVETRLSPKWLPWQKVNLHQPRAHW